MKKKSKILKFPDGFLWGTAISAYQVEGGITQNDWVQSSRISSAGLACDHYHRYEQDFILAKKLNQNAQRISLEWSRIEPAKDQWDEEELHHYFHALKFLKDQRFTTFVTLHHFTNPIWIAKAGGWKNRDTIKEFVNYVSKIVQALGPFIDFWITINEPNIYANLAIFQGVWPPFERSIIKTYQVYRNMLEAHNRAYEIIHAYYPKAKVGFAQNIACNEPFNRASFFDNLLVRFSDWVNVDYPLNLTNNDFIGLNHYFRNLRKFGFAGTESLQKEKKLELTDKGWEIYPKGIYKVLISLKKFKKPIYITENGIADAKDQKRAKYITEYLSAIYQAIKKGVPVHGYFYWSLLDNYEWPVREQEKTGYEMKFGLVGVDFSHELKRKVRKSARAYAEICKTNSLIV